MTDAVVKNKTLMQRVNKIHRDDFIKAAQQAGFVVTKLSTGSHYAIRRSGFEHHDIRGLITNVFEDMSKQTKMKIIKRLIAEGADEDTLWKNLGIK